MCGIALLEACEELQRNSNHRLEACCYLIAGLLALPVGEYELQGCSCRAAAPAGLHR